MITLKEVKSIIQNFLKDDLEIDCDVKLLAIKRYEDSGDVYANISFGISRYLSRNAAFKINKDGLITIYMLDRSWNLEKLDS